MAVIIGESLIGSSLNGAQTIRAMSIYSNRCYIQRVQSFSCILLMSTHTLTQSISQDGLTALILAAKEGCTKTVKILLDAGADVNIQEKVAMI